MSEVAQAPHSSPDGHSPQLRFPEFSGNWEEVPFYDCLNDILDFRGRTPLKIGMDWGGGNIISLSANNVKNGYIDFNAECHLGSGELYEKWMGKVKLVKNDIVFTMEAPLGKALLVPDDKRYILSQRVVAFKTKDYIDNLYFIQLIWSNKFQNTVDRLSTGSTAKGINQKSLKKVFVNIPLKPEQQKIAAFLTAVDNKIEQLSKKQELLGEYKKGVMQQIFSQAIRFKADDGCEFPDWAEKKLGGVVSTPVSDGPHLTPKFVKQGVPFLSVNNLVESKIDFSNVRHISIDDHLIFSKKCKPKKGDVLLGKAASVGKVAFVETDVEFNIWSPIAMIRPSNSNFSKYIYYCFQTRFILNQISKFTNSSSQGNIGMGDISKIIIKLPNKLEQTKIANFLSAIDSKIEQVGEQLDESKQFKKALLQQMFV